MSFKKWLGLVLLVAGGAGLFYGSFSYIHKDHEAQLGSLDLTVRSKQTVDIPIWASILVMAVGGGLLLSKDSV